MRISKQPIGLTVVLTALIAASGLTSRAAAQTETILYNFSCCPRGTANQPFAGLIADSAGNLYGTTYQGGSSGHGTVYELSPTGGGAYSEAIIYNFGEKPGATESGPESGLTLDSAGNLYGTRSSGGTMGFGMVFKLTKAGDGTWSLTSLHNFTGGKDGDYPEAGVIFDSAGNLYGTTFFGGAFGRGAVYELSPAAGSGWKEQVLHSFNHNGVDGTNPDAGVVLDSAGNVYGTTRLGGSNFGKVCQIGCGTVYKLAPASGGHWTETILHNFADNGIDGAVAFGGLIIDGAGNLYGATNQGGTGTCKGDGLTGCGTVFELSPATGGTWTETILHSFLNDGIDGNYPQTGTLLAAGGNLYGTGSGRRWQGRNCL